MGGAQTDERVGGACARSARDITGGIYRSVRIFCMKSEPKRVNAMLNRLVSMRRRRWSHSRRLKMRIHNFHKRGNRALPSTGMLTFVNKCCQHLTKSAPVNAHDGIFILEEPFTTRLTRNGKEAKLTSMSLLRSNTCPSVEPLGTRSRLAPSWKFLVLRNMSGSLPSYT